MKTLVIYLAKKYIVAAINDLLKKYKDDVDRITITIRLWSKRLQNIIDALQKLNDRIADADLDDDEIKASMDDIEALIKEF